MIMLNINLCYKEVCSKGPALYQKEPTALLLQWALSRENLPLVFLTK